MKLNSTLFGLLAFALMHSSLYGQTTLSGGEITGTLSKAGSPYTVTADLTVPKGQSLEIEPGVQMYFAQHIGMDVYGQITARGTASDSIIFTATDTALGWYGLRIRKSLAEDEAQSFAYCRFSDFFRIINNWRIEHGVLSLDSASNVIVENSLFTRNKSAFGSGLQSFYSNVNVYECAFKGNIALDTNTLLSNAISSVSGSAVSFRGAGKLNMKSCLIENNRSYTPYYEGSTSQDHGGGHTVLCNGVSNITDCIFNNNQSQTGAIFLSSGQWQRKDSLILTGCTFYQNEIQHGAILALNGSSDDQYNAVITDCIFEENKGPITDNTTSTVQYYNSTGNINEVTMDGCTLLNNDNYRGVSLISGARLYYNNGTIQGQNGVGFDIDNSVNCRILNSVIANNYSGVKANFNSQLGIINSTIAYNGNEPTQNYSASYGLLYNSRGRIDLINSIVTENKGGTGRMANVVSTTRYYFPGYLHNSIVQGGTDSSFKFIGGTYDIEEGSTEFSSIKNLITAPVSFVRPPAGIGRAYASLNNDFHILENCNPTPVYDAGDYFNPPYPLNSWNDRDKDGNPRIQGAAMDIGPYELKGLKYRTDLLKPWRDTTLCDNHLAAFNPQIIGHTVDYRWQSSTDNTTWTDMPAQSYDGHTLIDPTAAYYRVITTQAECNVVDTFGSTQLSVEAAPRPYLGNDTSIYRTTTALWLTPGTFDTYTWNITTKDTSHATLPNTWIQNFDRSYVWVDVTNAENDCVSRDSLVVQILYGVGISEQEPHTLILYPNPARNYIQLDQARGAEAHLTVVNLTGKVVVKQTMHANSDKLDVSQLPAGTYTAILTQDGKQYTTRFIKE